MNDLKIPEFRQWKCRMKIFIRYDKGWVYCVACCGWLRRRAKGRHARAHERAGWPMLDLAVWKLPVHGTDIIVEGAALDTGTEQS